MNRLLLNIYVIICNTFNEYPTKRYTQATYSLAISNKKSRKTEIACDVFRVSPIMDTINTYSMKICWNF